MIEGLQRPSQCFAVPTPPFVQSVEHCKKVIIFGLSHSDQQVKWRAQPASLQGH